MDDTIKFMHVDKSLGPDGFNGKILKTCWPIICNDFYNLAAEFHGCNADLEGLNSSFITLIRKKPSPETVNDFRPISLTSVGIKFLTKMAANRLQKDIRRCIHKKQYGFIKDMSIQDGLAWNFEYLHQCHQSKRPLILLKIDFEKAFDSIEHAAILEILRFKGFPSLWRTWVKLLLDTSSSAVLLNGIPGKHFKCRRGVREGDPL